MKDIDYEDVIDDIKITCSNCLNELDYSFDGAVLTVDFCERCKMDIEANSSEEGYDNGFYDGKEKGYEVGYEDAQNEAPEEPEKDKIAYDQGYEEVYADAKRESF